MAKTIKVLKNFSAVKVPKSLRPALRDLARTQDGKAILAEALIAAAGVLVAHEARPGSRTRKMVASQAPRVKAKAKTLVEEARKAVPPGSSFEEAARAFTEAVRRRKAQAASAPAEAPPPAATAPAQP
jgi:hypothetical protein